MSNPYLVRVDSQYGAPMGRRDCITDTERPYRFRLNKIPLNQGGYDYGGAYWGTPDNLYRAEGVHDDVDEVQVFYFRANSRQEAEEHVLQKFPNSKLARGIKKCL